jgi:hypothetical protein
MQADALSRFSTDHVSNRDANRQVTVLTPQYFLVEAHAHFRPNIDTLQAISKPGSLP